MSQTAMGLIVSAHGRHVVIELPDGQQVRCMTRGKKSEAVVGDRVHWAASGDEGVIERIEPRRNLFHRQDLWRSKSFAANIDQILVLLAAQPEFSESQLARALIVAQAQQIEVLIGLNKADLSDSFQRGVQRLAPYVAMGYSVVHLSLLSDQAAPLKSALQGKSTLILGPSGAGKSTLTNALVPQAKALTREISTVLNSGKHTTTATHWYWVDRSAGTAIIDSPGFQEFGIHHVPLAQLAACMPDIQAHVGHCRFYNCTHLHEPGCGVRDALAAGQINSSRYQIYTELFAELSKKVY